MCTRSDCQLVAAAVRSARLAKAPRRSLAAVAAAAIAAVRRHGAPAEQAAVAPDVDAEVLPGAGPAPAERPAAAAAVRAARAAARRRRKLRKKELKVQKMEVDELEAASAAATGAFPGARAPPGPLHASTVAAAGGQVPPLHPGGDLPAAGGALPLPERTGPAAGCGAPPAGAASSSTSGAGKDDLAEQEQAVLQAKTAFAALSSDPQAVRKFNGLLEELASKLPGRESEAAAPFQFPKGTARPVDY